MLLATSLLDFLSLCQKGDWQAYFWHNCTSRMENTPTQCQISTAISSFRSQFKTRITITNYSHPSLVGACLVTTSAQFMTVLFSFKCIQRFQSILQCRNASVLFHYCTGATVLLLASLGCSQSNIDTKEEHNLISINN